MLGKLINYKPLNMQHYGVKVFSSSSNLTNSKPSPAPPAPDPSTCHMCGESCTTRYPLPTLQHMEPFAYLATLGTLCLPLTNTLNLPTLDDYVPYAYLEPLCTL